MCVNDVYIRYDVRKMSRVVSMRLPDPEATRLERLARVMRRSVGETARLLLEEKLREEEFPLVEFRSTSAGRVAHVKGSRLAVWHVALMARSLDAERLGETLQRRREEIESALAYADAFPDEVEPFVDAATSTTFEEVKRLVPWAEEVRSPDR